MLTDRDKLDYYIELYKELWRSFDARRGYEWKFNLAFWAALSVLAGQGLKGDFQVSLSFSGWIVFGAHLFLLALYLVWTLGVHSVNDRDREYAWGYKNAIEAFLRGEPLTPVAKPKRKWFGCLWSYSPITSIGITVVLLALSLLVFLPCCR